MTRRPMRHATIALMVLLAGVTSVLADSKDDGGGGQTRDDCLQQAELERAVAMANCGVYPQVSDLYGICMSNATNAYTLAMVKCDGAASIGGTRGRLGVHPGNGTTQGNGKGLGQGNNLGLSSGGLHLSSPGNNNGNGGNKGNKGLPGLMPVRPGRLR